MKRVILVCSLLLSSIFVMNAQQVEEKGGKGITANFNSLEASIGLGDDKTDNLSVGLNGWYFLLNDFSINAGLNYSLEKVDETYNSLDYFIGIRKYYKGLFAGVAYEGLTLNDFDKYESGVKVEVGLAHYLSKQIFIEPSLYYKRSFGDLDLNRLGLSIGIGICF